MSGQITRKGKYKVMNDTYYGDDTSDSMVKLLERLRLAGTRVRFHWGDTKTGKDWGDEWDVAGTIGRSMGPIKIPILIKSRNSSGGGGILTASIVKIRYANRRDGGVIYQHSKYHREGILSLAKTKELAEKRKAKEMRSRDKPEKVIIRPLGKAAKKKYPGYNYAVWIYK